MTEQPLLNPEIPRTFHVESARKVRSPRAHARVIPYPSRTGTSARLRVRSYRPSWYYQLEPRAGARVSPLDDSETLQATIPPAARHRVLRRCELRCEECGAEHERRVWKYLYDRKKWWPFVPGVPAPRRTLHIVDVRVVVVPKTPPWDGADASLVALCRGCWIWRAVDAARPVPTKRKRKRAASPGWWE
jgi:hypothetical protein